MVVPVDVDSQSKEVVPKSQESIEKGKGKPNSKRKPPKPKVPSLSNVITHSTDTILTDKKDFSPEADSVAAKSSETPNRAKAQASKVAPIGSRDADNKKAVVPMSVRAEERTDQGSPAHAPVKSKPPLTRKEIEAAAQARAKAQSTEPDVVVPESAHTTAEGGQKTF